MQRLDYYIAKALKILFNPSALRNCTIHSTAKVCSRCELNDVRLGKYSYIGYGCFGVNVFIGSFCSIADQCRIGGAMHPVDRVSSSPVFHTQKNILRKHFAEFPLSPMKTTVIGNDVWIGGNCLIKSGITIHDGAVIGMGSVVTHDIPPYEIWAGNPARKIRDRFDNETKNNLLKLKWWDWDDTKIMEYADCFDEPAKLIAKAQEII